MRVPLKYLLAIFKRIPKVNLFLFKKQSLFFVKRHLKIILTLFIVVMVTDLAILYTWSFLIPTQIKTSSKKSNSKIKIDSKQPARSNFIHSINVFHEGPVPPSLKETPKTPTRSLSQPILSKLSLALLGTLESVDPSQSIATIRSKYSQDTRAFFTGEVIDAKARITRIERRKVTFINLETSQVEYIEMLKEELALDFKPTKSASSKILRKNEKKSKKLTQPTHEGIKRVGPNEFTLDRSSINGYLDNLPDILQQARVEPQYKDGKMLGYGFTWIKDDSLFKSLGFEKGDIISSVDGKEVTSQMEAIELFNQLKQSSSVSIALRRGDKSEEVKYNVNEDASNRSEIIEL